MGKKDLLPAFMPYGVNFNVYPQYSRIEVRIAPYSVYKKIIDAIFIMQI